MFRKSNPNETMRKNELEIWDRLNNAGRQPFKLSWLEAIYSLDHSYDLRIAICEKIGLIGPDAWLVIKSLLDKYGLKEEIFLYLQV